MFQSKAAVIHSATVVGTNYGNLISVVLDDGESSERTFSAVVFGGNKIPTMGTPGIVVMVGNSGDQVFWLGSVTDAVSESKNTYKPIEQKPDEIFLSNPKKTAFLKISDNIISLANSSANILASKKSLMLTKGKSSIELNDKEFNLQTTKSRFRLTDDWSEIFTNGKINLISGSDVNIAAKGNVTISSGIYNSREKNFFKQYGGINKFLLKSSEAHIGIGSLGVINAGALTVNVCSGMFLGGAIPGSGSQTTFQLSVAQGDALIGAGGGNLEINCLNELYTLSLRTGNKPASPTYSEIKLKSRELTLENSTGVGSKIKLSQGTTTLTSDVNVEIKPTQKFLVNATMDIDMKSNAGGIIDVKTTLDLKGQSTIKLTTPQCDLSGATMIKAGQKTVVPTGVGPFCAVQICPILGIQHAGDVASG